MSTDERQRMLDELDSIKDGLDALEKHQNELKERLQNTSPIQTEIGANDTHSLKCPKCGESCGMHHIAVNIRDRSEGRHKGVRVRMKKAGFMCGGRAVASIDDEVVKHAGSKCEELAIEFLCECCAWVSMMFFEQHKGHTWVSFSPTREWRDPMLDFDWTDLRTDYSVDGEALTPLSADNTK